VVTKLEFWMERALDPTIIIFSASTLALSIVEIRVALLLGATRNIPAKAIFPKTFTFCDAVLVLIYR